MPPDFIATQLKKYRNQATARRKEAEEFCSESPYVRTKREVQNQLQENENYRASILRNVTPFSKCFRPLPVPPVAYIFANLSLTIGYKNVILLFSWFK